MGNACQRQSVNKVKDPSKKITINSVNAPRNNTATNSAKTPSKDMIDVIVNQVIDVLKENVYKNVKGQTSTPFVEKLKDNEKVYALGDLEGQIDLLYRFLIHNDLIKYTEGKGIEWTGGNTYVVQCGDQIDKNHRPMQDTDLGVILFMEFLYYLSNGRVISVLGNHELWNIDENYLIPIKQNNRTEKYIRRLDDYAGKFDTWYATNVNAPKDIHRHKIIQTKLFRNILLNRYIAYKIDKVLFSHAGILQEDIYSITDLNSIGNLITNKINYTCEKQKQDLETKCGSNKECTVCLRLWHRFFYPFKKQFQASQIPTNFISIIGHNNLHEGYEKKYMFVYAHRQTNLNKQGNIFLPIHILKDNTHFEIEYNASSLTDANGNRNKTIAYTVTEDSKNNDGYTVLRNVDNNNGYLVIIDINSLYDLEKPFRYLEINNNQNSEDTYDLKQHSVVFSSEGKDNQLLSICSEKYYNIFRNKIIPELYMYDKQLPIDGGSYRKFKKTDEKTMVKGKLRVLYKQGNTKYVKWNKEYVKLSTLCKKKAKYERVT